MMNDEAMNPNKNHFLLPLLLITPEQNTQQASITELFIYLIQYSFLFNESASEKEILKRDFSNNGELSSQNPNGARYLDPKYSRWISVDPALGEYVPGAGKANAKDAGGLPGMGGLFNSVNLSLFHYAGDNPVRYVDPDGRMYNNPFEKEFVYQVLGAVGVFVYNSSIILPVPNIWRAGSFIGGLVFYDWNTFIHELFHQIQYNLDFGAFPKLIQEYALNNQMAENGSIIGTEKCYRPDGSYYYKYIYDGKTIDNYTYQYSNSNLSEYKTLSDLPFYEAQAQFVGDYAELYFKARFGNGIDSYNQYKLKQMARIMKNSGYEETEAVKWIESNIE